MTKKKIVRKLIYKNGNAFNNKEDVIDLINKALYVELKQEKKYIDESESYIIEIHLKAEKKDDL